MFTWCGASNRMKNLLSGHCRTSLLLQVIFVLLIECRTNGQATDFVQGASGPVAGAPRATDGAEDPAPASGIPGHLQPLGSHRPPESPGVDVMDRVPDPEHFFTHYIKEGRPVVFRGAAKTMHAYQLWTDEYLSKNYGHLVVEVEEGKKENRSKDLWRMPLAQFIQNYEKEDVYLVTDVPKEMSDEFCLLRCLACGGFTQSLVSTVLWYSSGGTKSVLHFDGVDNINCVLDGRKDIFLVDKNEKASIDIDHPDGTFSGVDVEKVDLIRYPGLGQVPWYSVTLERGDCLFIPYRWFHSVQSTGRNLAVNVWFIHQLRFNASDCHDDPSTLPEFLPLSSIKTRAHHSEHLRSEIAHETERNNGSLTLAQYLAMDCMTSRQEQGTKLFEILDQDGDQRLSLDEVYSDGFTAACDALGIRSAEEEEEDGDGDGLSEESMESRQSDKKSHEEL